MNALWKSHPATAREIMENLPKDVRWAYTTVKTMLTRLVAKAAIGERKRGNTSVYEPKLSQLKARRFALRSLVDRVMDGTVEPIMHFLIEDKKLSVRERKRLIQMLEEMDRKGEGQDGSDK